MLSPTISRARTLLERTAGHLGFKRDDEARHIPWSVLRANNSYRWYFLGNVISDSGTWLQNTAQVLLAYHLEHSALAVGLVTVAQFTSPLLLGPWGGVLTDRLGGRRTLLCTQVAAALTALALASLDFAGLLSESGLVAGAVISGLAFTFALPARNITVQRLVPASRLKPAYAMDTVSYNLGRATAPLLVVAVGSAGVNFAWAFAANAASFAVFSVILSRARMPGEAEPLRRSRVLDGFLIAARNPRIMILLLMVAAVTIADDPILVLGPSLAMRLHAPPDWSGWFIAALGTGTVLGSFRRPRHAPALRLAAAALASLALCMLAFVFAPSVWVSAAAALGAGASCLTANSVTRTLLSREAGANGAAVMAVWAIAWAGSKPLASLFDGVFGSWIGPQWTGLLLAAPALVPFALLILMPRLGSHLLREPAVSPLPVTGARPVSG